MTIHELLDEYNLEPDDIRWSLCLRLTESLVQKLELEGPESVSRDLWSGKIGDDLYDMEERWTRDRGDRLNRSILDEGHLRDELSQISLDRINRRRQ
jgi:hypothetical protein